MTPPLEKPAGEHDPAPSGSAPREVLTISRLNERARTVLERNLGAVWVEGEISNLARPASGHLYFSLKDSRAQVRCAMFRNRNRTLDFRPENGLSVLAFGRVSLYTARGDYQLIVESIEAAGDGLLRLRFEQLKRKLDAEGLFDPARKRPLPPWPGAIGVVTSTSGAAVRDIVTVLARRCPGIPVIVYPTAVQGDQAAAEIVAAIRRANRRAECAVLIVGRGGGSLEDLWPFNEESVARAIVASNIPVVSAVGHEIDFTIADLAADLRAATPSAAAELVSPDTVAATRRLHALQQRLRANLRYALGARERELRQLQARLMSPRRRLEMASQRVDELGMRLRSALDVGLRLRRGRLGALASGVSARSPRRVVETIRREFEQRQARLRQAMTRGLTERRQNLERLGAVLRAVGPAATLERGYAIVTDDSGRVVRDAGAVSVDQEIETRLARGRLRSRVSEKDPGE